MNFRLTLFILLTIVFSCKKDNTNTNAECSLVSSVPLQPYSFPVWHPNSQLLGFNHTPLTGIAAIGAEPCTYYYYGGNEDSTGFYLMNKDGTGFKRVTNFKLGAPAWSPDGKWIAFSFGPSIYKMPFNGVTFDTTQIIQLTTIGANFFPSWTANSDTIYYDSNVGTNGVGYYLWKMASDGSGKTGFPNTGRLPFVGSDNKVYYMGLQLEVYSMNKDGSNKMQLTFNGNINGTSTGKNYPKYYNGKVFYQQIGLWSVSINGNPIQLDKPCVTYDISTNGEIVYSRTDFDVNKYNKQIGTLWIMNADGSIKRQLTFNNF